MAHVRKPSTESQLVGWTFLSNHAHVFLCIAKEPEIRLRDVSEKVGITERAVQRIVSDLERGGYVTRTRSGRRNLYRVHADQPLRHPIESHRQVRMLLDLVSSTHEDKASRDCPARADTCSDGVGNDQDEQPILAMEGRPTTPHGDGSTIR